MAKTFSAQPDQTDFFNYLFRILPFGTYSDFINAVQVLELDSGHFFVPNNRMYLFQLLTSITNNSPSFVCLASCFCVFINLCQFLYRIMF